MLKGREAQWTEISLFLSRLCGLDVEYFLKSGLWVSLRYAFVSLSGLLLSIGFARFGTQELLGQYQSILAFLALLSVLSLPGLNLATFQGVTEKKMGALIAAVRYSFLISLFAIPIILGYAAWNIWSQGNEVFGSALLLGSLFFPFFYAPNTWYVFYEAQSLFAPVSRRMIFVSSITTFGLVLGLYFEQSLLTLLLIYFGISTIFNWLFFFEVLRKIKPQEKTEKNIDIRYGLSVTIQKFMFSLAENVPVLAISFLFGFAKLALFQIAYFFMMAISGLLSGLSATYLPFLFQNKALNHGKIIVQNLVIGALLFVVFRVFIEILFIPFYGERYRESLDIARALSPLVILFPLKTFLITFFTAQKKNFLIIGTFLFVNACSLGSLFLLRDVSLLASVMSYLFILNIGLVLIFLSVYFFNASKKTASSRSPIRS